MKKENLKPQNVCHKSDVCEDVVTEKGKKDTRQIIFSGSVQYIFVPVTSGFLTAVILISGLPAKLNLEKFSFINFPTIKIHATTSSTYSGLMFAAGLGCVLGLMFYQILKFAAKSTQFYLIKVVSPEEMQIPSAAGFFKSILHLVSMPLIIVLAAITARDLAKTNMLPGVAIDLEYQLFEVTSLGVVIIAALGCFLVFLFDAGLTIFLKRLSRKEVQAKEVEIY